jgi:hypothetical protein
MEITQKGIEALGFELVVRCEKTGESTYRRVSKLGEWTNKYKGWYCAIVHHPLTGIVHVSHHGWPIYTMEYDFEKVSVGIMTMEELTNLLERRLLI